MIRSAIISSCGFYRYRLERTSDVLGRTIMFLMVNPSMADDKIDDPTVRKCVGFAERNGFGRVLVGNLFAYRATDVTALRLAREPIGQDNDAHLRGMFAEAAVVVAAWGAIKKIPEVLRPRWREVVKIADAAGVTPRCLGVNADKHPRHPLMLPYDTPLSPWEVPWFAGRRPSTSRAGLDGQASQERDHGR